MSTEILKKLVDLYAAHELPLALEEEMEFAALGDAELAHEMRTLREACDALKEVPEPEFDAEIQDRIFHSVLRKHYGSDDESNEIHLDPRHYQMRLPIRG